MATVESFDELDIWKRARVLANKIYDLTCEGTFSRDYSLKDQINRSAGSVMDNIAEGFERGGNKEFITFLSYSKGSAGEVQSQLYRAVDRKHIQQDTFNDLMTESLAIGRMIGGLMSYLKNSDMRGSKFHESDLEYRASTEFRIPSSEFRIPDSEFRIPSSEFGDSTRKPER